jgi:hypothetical protein
MSPAERAELYAEIDAELAAMVADGTLVLDGDRYRLGEASRIQQHATRAIADACGYCGKDPCPDRDVHDRWDAGNEVTWWRRWTT